MSLCVFVFVCVREQCIVHHHQIRKEALQCEDLKYY